MPEASVILSTFTAGELSPRLAGRVDLKRYFQGCKVLLNNVVHPHGGASRRFGTRYVAEVKDSSKATRVIPFSFSSTQAYILEMGDEYIRLFLNNGQLLGADITVDEPGFETAGGGGATVVNPGFETAGGGGADVFGTWVETAGDGAIADEGTIVNDGSHSCKLTAGATANTKVVQAGITVAAETTYKLCFYARGDGVDEGRFLVYDVSNGADIVAIKVTGVTAATWTKVTESFDTPVGCTEVRVEFHCSTTDTAVCYFDTVWFETDVFAGWTENAGDGAIAQETSLTHEGSGACKLTAGATTDTEVTQNRTVIAETNYELRFYTCGGDATNEGRFAIYDVDNAAYISAAQNTGITSIEYGEVAHEFTVPAACTTIRIEFWCPDTDTKIAYFDSVILKNIDAEYEISSPWTEAQLFNIKYAQDADTMYQVHPDVSPRKLTRTAHDEWTVTEVDFQDGPYLEEVADIDITPSGTTGSITLTAASPIFKSGHVGALFRWKADDAAWYWLKITAFTSRTVVTATVKGDDLPNTNASNPYRFGAWSPDQGYPNCVAFYEQRLIFAGNPAQPQRIYGSKSQDYENFEAGSNADDAWIYQMAAEEVNSIVWLTPARYLNIGTIGGEWIMSSGSEDAPITPTAVKVRQESNYGSYDMAALRIGLAVLFVQRPGLKVREITYRYSEDSFAAQDLTILSEHITEGATAALSGIVDWAYQSQPDSIIWCVRADGALLGFTYEKIQEVFAWHRHKTEGADGDHSFESVATIPTSTHDQAWVIVNRTINGSTARYVEYLESAFFEQEDAFFVDSGLSYESTKYNITGATAADPVVITAVGHPYSDGDYVYLEDLGGMTEVNDLTFVVDSAAANTFELNDRNGNDIDGSVYTAYTSGGTVRKKQNSFTGLSHLEGEEVALLVDGAVAKVQAVASGVITTDVYGAVVHAGLHSDSVLEPMRLEPGSPTGTGMAKKKRITKAHILLHETLGGKVGHEDGAEDDLVFRSPDDPMGSPPELYSGFKEISWPGPFDKDAFIRIVQDVPLPMTILAIMPVVDVSGD